jgi:hypothetical protein
MKKTCVSAGDISDALGKLPNFIGKTMGPARLFVFVHLYEMTIFEDITCVDVEDGTNEVNSVCVCVEAAQFQGVVLC